MIDFQRKLLGDRLRNEAFAKALGQVIKKGVTTLADIGSGTGFLSFLASRLGAKECHLYEYSEALALSKKLARANHIKNCRFTNQHSADVKNPSKADVVISETLGNFALEENIIENLNDAKRFLKPGGVVIPSSLKQFVAPVITPRIMDDINIWDCIGFDLDLRPAKEIALNNMYVYKILPKDLFRGHSEIQQWDAIDFTKKNSSLRSGCVTWMINDPVTFYGFALFWECEVLPGITISTSPFAPPTHWDQIFLPLLTPLTAKPGDAIELLLKSDSRYQTGINVRWETSLLKGEKHRQEPTIMDMKRGMM